MTDWFFDLERLVLPVKPDGAKYDERLRQYRETHEFLKRVGTTFEL